MAISKISLGPVLILLLLCVIIIFFPISISSINESPSSSCFDCMTAKGMTYKLGLPYRWLTINSGTREGGMAALPSTPYVDTEVDANNLILDGLVYIMVGALFAGLLSLKRCSVGLKIKKR